MWLSNKKVLRYYTTANSQNLYAFIADDTAWRRVKPGSPDGVTNMAVLFSAARTHDRNVTVYVDESDGNQITHAYMS